MMPPMSIETGVLTIDKPGTIIRPGFSMAEFSACGLVENAILVMADEKLHHYWYNIGNVVVAGKMFFSTITFQRSVVHVVELFGVVDGEEWMLHDEPRRKVAHDLWLETMLGAPPYVYPWGTISSVYSYSRAGGDYPMNVMHDMGVSFIRVAYSTCALSSA